MKQRDKKSLLERGKEDQSQHDDPSKVYHDQVSLVTQDIHLVYHNFFHDYWINYSIRKSSTISRTKDRGFCGNARGFRDRLGLLTISVSIENLRFEGARVFQEEKKTEQATDRKVEEPDADPH